MGKRNERLYTIPYQDARAYCGKCDYVKRARAELDNGNLTAQTLGDMRSACMKCRTATTKPKKGIYKADAILGIYRNIRPPLPTGKGRSSIIPSATKDAIWTQVQAGITYREIAKRTGYSPATISRIVQERLGRSRAYKSYTNP